jgi:hypothetical protein
MQLYLPSKGRSRIQGKHQCLPKALAKSKSGNEPLKNIRYPQTVAPRVALKLQSWSRSRLKSTEPAEWQLKFADAWQCSLGQLGAAQAVVLGLAKAPKRICANDRLIQELPSE